MITSIEVEQTISTIKDFTVGELIMNNITVLKEDDNQAISQATERIGLSVSMTALPGEDDYKYQLGNAQIRIISWIREHLKDAILVNKVVVLATVNKGIYTYTISVYKI